MKEILAFKYTYTNPYNTTPQVGYISALDFDQARELVKRIIGERNARLAHIELELLDKTKERERTFYKQKQPTTKDRN